MKALVSAFALLSFVAATTIPYVAHAQTQTTHSTPKKSNAKKKPTKKASHKKTAHKKVAKKSVKKPTA
jgi:hypothetical protein